MAAGRTKNLARPAIRLSLRATVFIRNTSRPQVYRSRPLLPLILTCFNVHYRQPTTCGAVVLRLRTAIILVFLTLPPLAGAEIFVGNKNSIAVFSNTDNGQDYNPIKRLLKGNSTGLDDISDLVVYQPPSPGRAAGIYVCNRGGDGLIKVFPVGAAGNVLPSHSIETLRPCEGLAISNGVLFTVPIDGGYAIELHDLAKVGTPIPDVDAWEPNPTSATLIKSITTSEWLDEGVQFYDVEVFGDNIFVLAKPTPDLNVSLYVFDISSDSYAEPKRVVSDTRTHKAWGLNVFEDEIYIATSGTMSGYDITTFDADESGSTALRYIFYEGRVKGPLSDFVAYDSMIVDGELYVVGHTSGVYVFDKRVGGLIPEPWRAIWNDELDTSASLYVTSEENPNGHVYQMALEEPAHGAVYSGIANLRGWAVATDTIAGIDVFVDGEFLQKVPYGGARPDVAETFPLVAQSSDSGFSMAFNYNSLSPGQHTITVRARDGRGEILESSATFTVNNFGVEFIADSNLINMDGGVCEIQGQSASLLNVLVNGSEFDIGLQWRRSSQSFAITAIEER